MTFLVTRNDMDSINKVDQQDHLVLHTKCTHLFYVRFQWQLVGRDLIGLRLHSPRYIDIDIVQCTVRC